MAACALVLHTLVATAGGCGGAAVRDEPRERDLDGWVPDGYTSLLRLRPRALFADDATARAVEAIVPSTRLDAFRDRHGVDLRTLEQLSFAEYEGAGTVVLAEGPFLSHVVVQEVGHRMAPLESSADAPVLRRAGIYQMQRFELLALASHELALVHGPPELSGLVLHEHAPSESRLADRVRRAATTPLIYVRHGRPDLPPEGIGLVLARLEDIVATIEPAGESDPGSLAIRLELLGELPPGAEDNLGNLVASLSESDLGRAVGMEEIARTLTITRADEGATLAARVRSSTLVRGLRVLFGAEIEEMLDETR